MRKFLSILLSLLIAFSAVTPGLVVAGAYTERASDAYAVIFSASDFQSDTCYTNFSNMMQAAQSDGITETPDGFLFGGDYTAGSEDPSVQVPKVIDTIQGVYAGYPEDNMIFVQGNHDAANSVLTNTGFHAFEDFVVYSINEDDFKHSQYSKTGYGDTVSALAEKVAAEFDVLTETGDKRPVFVITHVPLHHSSRSSYGDNLYSKYLFDVLNKYGEKLDIVFLFGHNHSSTYDDYIGGAVNYLAKGEEIRIPIPDTSQQGASGYTKETLNFTYMNCGYVGYSNNSESSTSTKTLTMSAIELCPTRMVVSRYTTSGQYNEEIIELVNPLATDPYVKINCASTAVQGNGGTIFGSVANIDAESYSWSTSDSNVITVLPAGKNAQIICKNGGTADITLTVTDKDGNVYSDTLSITVKAATEITETIIPGTTYEIFELTDKIVAGEKYILASSSAEGTASAVSNVPNNNGKKLKAAEVTVLNNAEVSPYAYIDSSDSLTSSVIWTATESSTAGQYIFTNGSNLYAAKRSELSISADTDNTVQWTYSDKRLVNAKHKTKIELSGTEYALTDAGTEIFLYQKKTVSTPDEIVSNETALPYVPSSVLKNGSQDVDGLKLKFYEASYGDTLMLNGSYSGFSASGADVVAVWSSSDPSVATVENGLVTFVSSGEATICYTVSDGQTTLEKSVKIFISRATKPVDKFVLTDEFVAGQSYVFANTNIAGSGYIMGYPIFSSGHESYDIRFTSYSTEIEEIDGEPTFCTDDDSFVWNAVADKDGNVYLVNDKYNCYLYAAVKPSSSQLDLGTTEDASAVGTKWHMNSNGYLVSDSGNGLKYSSDNNFRACAESKLEDLYFYRKVISAPFVTLKLGTESVDGVEKTIFEVSDETAVTLNGTHDNFGEEVTVEWISSDSSIAVVDENGVVRFTGKAGLVDVTYLVSDSEGNSDSATVAFNADNKSEPTVAFKYTDTIKPGRRYIILSSKVVGSTYLMSGEHYSEQRLRAGYNVVQPDSADGSSYVSVPVSSAELIWIAEASSTDGSYYLKNQNDATYLFAGIADNAVSTEASLSTYDSALYEWTYDGTLLKNGDINADTAMNAGIRFSGDLNFRLTKTASSEEPNVYLFEETVLTPYVHIRSRYVSVENTTMSRAGISPRQTETLMPKVVHFPNARLVDYEWTSSNPDVATIDNNGVVTYTGKAGEVTFTVTATSKIADSDDNCPVASSSTKIVVSDPASDTPAYFYLTTNFVPGEFYLLAPVKAAGESVILSNSPNNTDSANALNGVVCSIESSDNGLRIYNDDADCIWECVDSVTAGYYYLRNAATGEYLALVVDDGETPYRQVVTTHNLNEYSSDAYLIAKNTSSPEQVYSKQSAAYVNADGASANFLRWKDNVFKMSSSTSARTYIYQRTETVPMVPEIEIKKSTFLGTDTLTNVLQNRYSIEEGDSEQLLSYTKYFGEISSVTWAVTDESIATIDENGLLSYTGRDGFVSVILTVEGIDNSGNAVTKTERTTFNVSGEDYEVPTEDYPQYPHEGSVRINKTASNEAGGKNFQDTGVTEVELSVTGVPLPQAVDVVVVFDHSSNMNDGGRLQSAIEDTREFALQVVNSNPLNRIAVVTFDRYRNDYKTITSATADYTTNSSSTEDRIITGDGTPKGAFMTIDSSEELVAQIDSLAVNNIAGTNYDYGLQECYNILEAAKDDPAANKKQYVVFMSDGEPYVFNRTKVVYGTDDADGVYNAWLTGDTTNEVLNSYREDPDTYPAAQYFNPRGENWFAEIIKTEEGKTISDMPTLDYYDNYRNGLGATIFTIGYGAGAEGTVTNTVLTTMASTADNFYYAEGDLQAAYDSILQTILYAANNAVVTDKMGENFDLQFASSFSLGNGMADIVLEPAPYIEIGSWTLNSDGTRNQYTVHETITFQTNANGDLTEAYSTECDGNIYDVAASTINGKYVSYNLLDEVFTWNIGDITRDEITLRYYAYLSGSAEGEREAGVYDTNEYARLDYINYRGSVCHQTFPVPSLGWKQAAVNYEFYIVNEKGEPVNRNGIVVPFAERVLIGQEQTKDILLNSAGEYTAYTLVAKEELPDGYVLFNQNASYQIAVSSGTNPSKAVICDELAVKTTYFRDGTITICCDGEVPGVHDYTNTHVSFAVLYTKGIVPDTVVIDYGLPVKISVLANDYAVSGGRITRIGTSFTEEIDYKNNSFDKSMLADGVEAELTLPDGIAAIDGDKIVFTPTTLTMDTENVFYYEYQDTDGEFYYAQVTVIPAANIYYEESFFTFTDGNGYVWKTAGETLEDKYQAEDRPGNFSFADADANFVYGYDSAYADSCTYSLGSAKYTSVDSKSFGKEPVAEFTFCGTGFDLFSVTNVDTGAVLVTVYKDSAVYKNFIVNTYYGYTYDSETDKYVPNPDSKESLWQVPVISARDLGYNTYRVVVKPLYSSMFDMAYDKNGENNSYDIYVDSVRIYDPAGADVKENTVIGDAYIADGEFSPSYCEIRRNILDAKSFNAGVETLPEDAHINGAIFIDGSASLDDAVSDLYLEHGPNNELYLAKGQAVAFHISSDRKLTLSSLQLGMKVVSGDNADVVIMNTNELVPRTITVSGATESYRRLNSAIVWDQTELDENGTYKTKYPIVILNNSKEDAVVSLTQFKWAYTSAPESGDEAVTLSLNADTPMMAFAAVRRVQEASVTEDETESFPYTEEEISISWADTELTEGETAVLKVVTPVDVVRVTVDGIDITECEIDEQGNKLWTYSFVVNRTGESTFDILLFDNDGNVSSTISSDTITVEESEEITDDESGEGTDDEPMSILEIIMNWFKKIITFFRRVFG